jgi:type I restriction enzyme S subunit
MIAIDVKYKKTDNEWVPEIPEHWDFRRLKNFAVIGSGQDQKGIENDNGKYSIYGTGGVMGKTNSFLYEGPSVILGRKGTIDSPFYLTEPFWTVDTAYYTKIKDNVDPRFFFYCCLTIEFDFYKYGSAVPSMSQRDLYQIRLPYPPFQEQQAIADFLDLKCKKINHFLETKQHFIALLKEQRQSIITHAVTKGIDENVRLKETVIGALPEKWNVRRLKYLAEVGFSTVDKHSYKEEKEVRLCNYLDVYNNEYIRNDFELMKATASEAEIKRFTVQKGDVMITKDSETPGDIAVPALVIEDMENTVCGYHLAHIKPHHEKILSEFLFRLFQSKKINSHFEVAAKGVTRYGLSYDDINSVFLPVPPTTEEQQSIINYIRTETKTLDIAISKAEKEIELMKEYKEATIAEAVTGKMKPIN